MLQVSSGELWELVKHASSRHGTRNRRALLVSASSLFLAGPWPSFLASWQGCKQDGDLSTLSCKAQTCSVLQLFMYMEATKPWACRINRYFGTSLGKSRENYAFGGTTVIELLIWEEKKEKKKKKTLF